MDERCGENIILDEEICEERYMHLIDACNLRTLWASEQAFGSKSDLDSNSYSGGELQRISLARELYKNPNFIVLDEPTSALDKETTKTIKRALSALRGRASVLLISHDLGMLDIADQVYQIDSGELKPYIPL